MPLLRPRTLPHNHSRQQQERLPGALCPMVARRSRNSEPGGTAAFPELQGSHTAFTAPRPHQHFLDIGPEGRHHVRDTCHREEDCQPQHSAARPLDRFSADFIPTHRPQARDDLRV